MEIRTVLIVDDDEEMLDLFFHHLSRRGLKVSCARDGVDALEKILLDPPDIVLLDIMMPRMNGWETCRTLKADPATRHIPVLFLTCKGLDEDILKMHRADADGYFIKPFDIAELACLVANWGSTDAVIATARKAAHLRSGLFQPDSRVNPPAGH